MKPSRARYATSIVLLAVLAFWTADLPPADAQEAARKGTVRTHLSAERPQAGEDVRITVELSNPTGNPEMVAAVQLRAPDGTNWSDRRCPVTCEAMTPVGPGTNRTVEFALTVNDPGPKTVEGSTTWTTGAGGTAEESLRLQIDVRAPTDDTSVELHASDARVHVGGNLAAHLSVINNHPSESMDVTMALKPPEGTSVTATHNAESCAGECKATYAARPGEQRTMTVILAANDAGEFVLAGSARWRYPGTQSRAGSTNKYLVLDIDRPPTERERPLQQAPMRAPEKRHRFPDWTYPAVLGGLSALCALAALTAGGIAWRQGRRPQWPGTPDRTDPKVRMLTALIMVAGVALAVTAVFDQPEGTSGRDALMLVLPGAAAIAGAGVVQKLLTPAFALALATTLCPWAAFYIGWSGRADPERAVTNAVMALVLIAGVTAACCGRRAMSPAGN